MARNPEKAKREKIREQYARKYAGILQEKDETIQNLKDQLLAANNVMQEFREEQALQTKEMDKLKALVQTLQNCTGLSDEDMDRLKSELERQDRAMQCAKELDGAMEAVSGVFQTYAYQAMGNTDFLH